MHTDLWLLLELIFFVCVYSSVLLDYIMKWALRFRYGKASNFRWTYWFFPRFCHCCFYLLYFGREETWNAEKYSRIYVVFYAGPNKSQNMYVLTISNSSRSRTKDPVPWNSRSWGSTVVFFFINSAKSSSKRYVRRSLPYRKCSLFPNYANRQAIVVSALLLSLFMFLTALYN